MKLEKLGVAAALVVMLVLPVTALAGGKHGGGGNAPTAARCTASGTVVQATGLPTGQLINFMVSAPAGTTGWVLGYTTDGTWSVTVPAGGGATYQFVGVTSGSNGSKYTVYASCSA